ncbi:MAG: PepSY domain-containing protein [Proteobacteria bacterium]|nr:PepSY domain-containing protein [Pseudomonadota bacterium]
MSDLKRRSVNWHWLHSVFGLTLSLYLGFIFITGTLLVFANEIDWLRYSAMRVVPAEGGKLPWGRVYDAAAADRPGWSIVRVVRDEGPRTADLVVMLKPGDPGDHFIWVDPYRAVVQGETSTFSFHNALLVLHESLFIEGRKGKFLVTVLALPLTAAVIAGLCTYRRFWAGFFRMPRFGGRRRATLSDLHRLIAVWSLIFFIPLSATSLWYFVENLGLGARTEFSHRTEKRAGLLPAGFDGARLDAAVQVAEAAMPGFNISAMSLPRTVSEPLLFQGQMTALLVRDTENSVHVDPTTLAVVATYRGEDLSLHQRVSAAADPIHFGYFAGLTTRILWFVFGIALTALVVAGILINATRLAAMAEKRSGSPTRPGIARSLLAMGPLGAGAWLSVALMLWGLYQLVRNFFAA